MPKTLVKDESTATDTYAKFTAEPFEAGYGHTVGNSLRRVLLSSLEGAAITAAKIAGAQHEFAIGYRPGGQRCAINETAHCQTTCDKEERGELDSEPQLQRLDPAAHAALSARM